MFARYTYRDEAYVPGSVGLNPSSTLSSVFIVVLTLSVLSYLPSYLNVLPGLVTSPSRTACLPRVRRSLSGRSVPTTATSPVFVKRLADTAAYDAAPPRTFLRVLFGVLMVSRATEPKTVSMNAR